VNAYTSPTITFRYKHSTVKQYLKEGLALRTETTVNEPTTSMSAVGSTIWPTSGRAARRSTPGS
jgi:hypothetical protein